jgi:hypothetical protein
VDVVLLHMCWPHLTLPKAARPVMERQRAVTAGSSTADHLHPVAGKETEKFAACVKALHGNVMEAYLDWCEHVRLPARVPGVQYSSLTSNTRAPVTHCGCCRLYTQLAKHMLSAC